MSTVKRSPTRSSGLAARPRRSTATAPPASSDAPRRRSRRRASRRGGAARPATSSTSRGVGDLGRRVVAGVRLGVDVGSSSSGRSGDPSGRTDGRSCRRPRLVGPHDARVGGDRCASSSSWGPAATSRPWSRNSTRSASSMVDTRWATTSVVVSRVVAQAGEDLRLDHRVDGGGGVVEHQHAGPAEQRPGERDPLALAARERDAPLARRPCRSPRAARRTKRSARATRAAAATSSGVVRLAQGDVLARWSRRRGTSPGTPCATAARSSAGSTSSVSTPPMRTVPSTGSARRTSRSHSVLLPEPVEPTMATTSPGATVKVEVGRAPGRRSRRRSSTSSNSTASGPSGSDGRRRARATGAAASTASIRAIDTTARGISWRKKPTTRIGKARRLNRATPCTRSPVSSGPVLTCHEPMSSRTMMPMFGMASIVGSKVPRMRPTRTRASRSSSARSPRRSISCGARPSVFTTRAPSKLSWATRDTWPTRSCTCADGLLDPAGVEPVDEGQASGTAAGRPAVRTEVDLDQADDREHRRARGRRRVNGNALRSSVAPRTSASAWASSYPVGWERWYRIGTSR